MHLNWLTDSRQLGDWLGTARLSTSRGLVVLVVFPLVHWLVGATKPEYNGWRINSLVQVYLAVVKKRKNSGSCGSSSAVCRRSWSNREWLNEEEQKSTPMKYCTSTSSSPLAGSLLCLRPCLLPEPSSRGPLFLCVLPLLDYCYCRCLSFRLDRRLHWLVACFDGKVSENNKRDNEKEICHFCCWNMASQQANRPFLWSIQHELLGKALLISFSELRPTDLHSIFMNHEKRSRNRKNLFNLIELSACMFQGDNEWK